MYHDPMRPPVFAILSLAALAGCAGWFMKGEPPEVLLINITPLESTAFEQRLQVDLRIRNPNDYDLEVTGMDVRLDLNGKRLARGLGNKEMIVPRLSESILSIETSTSTLDLVRQVFAIRKVQEVAYGISGVLHLKNGRLPFENSGVLLGKDELSGILTP